jgi:hypothetical protein
MPRRKRELPGTAGGGKPVARIAEPPVALPVDAAVPEPSTDQRPANSERLSDIEIIREELIKLIELVKGLSATDNKAESEKRGRYLQTFERMLRLAKGCNNHNEFWQILEIAALQTENLSLQQTIADLKAQVAAQTARAETTERILEDVLDRTLGQKNSS